jgi:alpha-glucosidase (family GH31 glycosyl hydrolase)
MSKISYLLLILFAFTIVSAHKPNKHYQYNETLAGAFMSDSEAYMFSQGTYARYNKHNEKEEFFGKNISKLAQSIATNVSFDSAQEFTIRITNPDKNLRFELPHEAPFSYTKVKPGNLSNLDYQVNVDGLHISIKRTSTNETIFDTTDFDFVFSDYYVEFTTQLPSRYMYGFGERARDFLYDTGLYTLWNKDQFAMVDQGQGNQQTYGFHPVYMMREASGKWHMIYLRTTNAMDIYFDAEKKTLKYMMTGEFVELKVFIGDEFPDTVIKMYHNYINGWAIQPFWSHGYHQCRWGYMFLNNFTEVVANMTNNGIPMDAIWSDIDYMDNFTDFTVDHDRFPLAEFKEFTQKVHWIPIIDAGVFINYTTPAYIRGNDYNVWIRSALNNSNFLVGIVWPGLTYWPDWLNPNSSAYWGEMLDYLYEQVPFSGIWLDMDENSNFCTGEFANNCFVLPNYLPDGGDGHINPYNTTINPIPLVNVSNPAVQPGTPVDPAIVNFNSTVLPYVPGKVPLEGSTLSINALHHGNVLEFDFHNLNSFYETQITYNSIYNITKKRPFILTRSSFVGTGQFSTHWTGDNTADWNMLRLSIPEIFNFQLFGIPMVGADICGFAGDTNVELCSRWMQLGSFYPFMRNHNKIDAINQEPYSLGPTVLETSRAALKFRYSILKYYYSIFIRNKQVGSVFRPLFFDFPNDVALLSLQTQFLVGSELMVAAVVDEGATTAAVYFPAGAKWFDFHTGETVSDNAASHITVNAPLNATLPTFIRDGSIVHTQNVANLLSSVDLDNKFTLVAALRQAANLTLVANGQLMGISNYQDDNSVNECLGNNDCLVNVSVKAQTQDEQTYNVTVNFSKNAPNSILEEVYVNGITFYGVRTKVCVLPDKFCKYKDLVVSCPNAQPHLVQFGQVHYTITKGSCVVSNDAVETISI